jgi:HlyD family secretion protein
MSAKKNKTLKKVIIFSAIGLLIAGLGLYAWLRKPAVVVTVNTEKVARRNLTELVVATGKIQPVVYVKISPEVSGEIIELPVKEGQTVKKGDLLMRIKPDSYIAYRNIAEANLKASQAQNTMSKASLDKATSEMKRYEDLYRTKLVSDSQYIDVKTAYDVAVASYESAKYQADNAKANLARAEEDLSKTTISSPLDGTISKLNSQLGERVVGTATYQGTEVMTISDLNDMEARVDIGEIDVVLIAVGQKARLEVDSFRDRKFTGIVSDIANTAKSAGSGQTDATKFEVRIRVQEKEVFRPGMSVTAEIETRYRTNVLTVPIQSVTTRTPKETPPGKGGTNAPTATAAASKDQTNAMAKVEKNGNSNAPTTDAGSASGTNLAGATNISGSKKANEVIKPVEVVFMVADSKAKMAKVKRGISDDSYVEILEGLTEGTEIVSGGYKAINRELEDDKKVKVDNNRKDTDKDEKKEGGQ